MTIKLGYACRVAQNTSDPYSWGTPVWTDRNNVIDAKCGGEVDEADVSTRGSGGFTLSEPALMKFSLDFNMVDDPDDAFLTAIISAYFNRTFLDIAALNGPSATSGSRGMRAQWKVFKFENGQPLKDKATFDISLKPCYPSAAGYNPNWMTIS